MPFKSQAQRRLFYAKRKSGEISPDTVKKWEDATPKGKKLPERLEKKAFYESFEKSASAATELAEVGGLGILAAPYLAQVGKKIITRGK